MFFPNLLKTVLCKHQLKEICKAIIWKLLLLCHKKPISFSRSPSLPHPHSHNSILLSLLSPSWGKFHPSTTFPHPYSLYSSTLIALSNKLKSGPICRTISYPPLRVCIYIYIETKLDTSNCLWFYASIFTPSESLIYDFSDFRNC